GFEVKVSAPTSLLVTGSESTASIALVPTTKAYLMSIPYESNLGNLEQVAVAYGLPTTGVLRGTILEVDPCTGTTTSVSAGTAPANARAVVPGRAYRLTWPSTSTPPATVTNPTTYTNDHDGDGDPDATDPCTDTDGDGYGNPGFP